MSPTNRYVNGILDIPMLDADYPIMPDDEKDPRVITPIPRPLLARIDDYRFKGRLPSRAEAIRRLIELGLAAAEKPQG